MVRGGQLFSLLNLNLANIAIYKSFGQEQTEAATRQRAMATAATFLRASLRSFSIDPEETGDMPMIQSGLRGLHFHRSGDLKNAAYWYSVAARGEPIPEQQNQILISPWMDLTPTGDFMLDAITEEWYVRSDTAPGAALTRTAGGTLEFTCSGVLEESKKAILAWNQLFDIPYHHTLVLKAKAEIGTTVNLETVIDDQLVRHSTFDGTGKWEDFTIPVEGDHVKYIYLIVREDQDSSNKSCKVELDSISFLLDPWIEDDRSR